MTTIAADRKSMAADTQISIDGAKYHAVKIFRVGDSIVGAAGTAVNCNLFMDWFRLGKPTERPELVGGDDDKDVSALELNPRGLFMYNGLTEPDAITDRFYAIGSGGSLALAAMELGRTPAQAVRVAHKRDPGTGSKVTELHLPPRQQARKPKDKIVDETTRTKATDDAI